MRGRGRGSFGPGYRTGFGRGMGCFGQGMGRGMGWRYVAQPGIPYAQGRPGYGVAYADPSFGYGPSDPYRGENTGSSWGPAV